MCKVQQAKLLMVQAQDVNCTISWLTLLQSWDRGDERLSLSHHRVRRSSDTRTGTAPLHQADRLCHSLEMQPGIPEIQAGRLDTLMQQMQRVLLAVADSAQNLVPFACYP